MGKMIGAFLKTSPLILVVASFITIFLLLPLPIAPGTDFHQLYCDIVSIAAGNPFYDQVSHGITCGAHLGRSVPIPLNPPAYPPWLYISLLPIASFPIGLSSRIWALLNVGMLAGSILVISRSKPFWQKAVLLILGLTSAPFIGHIVVGQQTTPVLLGISLITLAVEKRKPWIFAAALFLLSLKPHLGGFIILVSSIWLAFEEKHFLLSALKKFALVMSILVILSLLLDPFSLIQYPHSLQQLNSLALNKTCDTCSSIPILIGSFLPSNSVWSSRSLLSIFIFALGMITILKRGVHYNSFGTFLSATSCLLLLAAPYVRNYDYVIALFPLCYEIQSFINSWKERSTFPSIRSGLMMSAILVLCFLPYLLPREMQAYTLWLAPMLLLMSNMCDQEKRITF